MRVPSPAGQLPERQGPDVFTGPFILQGPTELPLCTKNPVTLAAGPAKAKEQGFKGNPKAGLRKACTPAPAKLACLSALSLSPLTGPLPFRNSSN